MVEEQHALLRYVTPDMANVFSPVRKGVLFRKLWVEIMREQRRLGVAIPSDAIETYERLAVPEAIDLQQIDALERKIKHDVTAHLKVFQEQAGHQFAHQGCTSRDITDNVELLQLREALEVIQGKVGAALHYFKENAMKWTDLPIAERTHNVPAQVSLLGRRFAMYGEPMLDDFEEIGTRAASIPFRGILGPIGTAKDQIDILGSVEKVEAMNETLMRQFGFTRRLNAPGQIFPRSIEANAYAHVISATNHAANYALLIRLGTGIEVITEGFDAERVGSSAMPHKMNPSRAERICSLAIAARGYGAMLQEVAGNQWYGGDVACSAARRLGVHDGFYAADGTLNTLLQILEGTTVFPGMVKRELETYGAYLASTGVLTALQHPSHGEPVGREDAHTLVKKHAVGSIMKYRKGEEHTFLAALAQDPRCPLTLGELEGIVKDSLTNVGDARGQIDRFVGSVQEIERTHPYLADIAPVKTV